MAQSPTFPDPSPNSREQTRRPGTDAVQSRDPSVVDLTRLLGKHGAGANSAGLALDLVLNEIAAQACRATNASGAAIALAHDGEFVCRATEGENAPELGSRLSSTSGLSAACIESCEVQRCDNPETDHRVDAAACRRLGVQSVLVVPLLKGGALLGIFEIFSSLPYAFSDREAQILAEFAQRVVATIAPDVAEKGEKVAPPENSAEIWSQLENTSVPTKGDEVPDPPSFAAMAGAKSPRQGHDIWTSILVVVVVGLALLLGWMLDHTSWPRVSAQKSAQTSEAPSRPQSNPTSGNASVVLPPAPDDKAPARDVTQSQPASGNSSVMPRPSVNPGGLTVYEGGKVIFEMKPVPGRNRSAAPASGHQGTRLQAPPDAVDSYVLQRVEPQYPEAARLDHVQGAVVLLVQVNKNGVVDGIQTLGGDVRLAAAAAEAVRQWRFRPYAPRGQALEFETQITVSFTLP